VCNRRSSGPLLIGLALALGLVAGCTIDDRGVAGAEPSGSSSVANGGMTSDAGTTARRSSTADAAAGTGPETGPDILASIDAAEVDAAEIDAAEIDAAEIDTAEVDTAEVDAAEVAKPLLLLSLPLDDSDGSMAAQDHSGLQQQVTLHRLNAARCWVDGHRGGALALQRNGYLQVGIQGALASLRAFSFATWFRRERTDDDGVLISRGVVAAGGYVYRLWISGAQLRLQLNDPGPLVGLDRTSRSPLPVRRWVHVAMTFDGQRARLYQDGALTDDWPYDQPLAAPGPTRPLLIGASESPGDEEGVRDRLTGRLDEVMFYEGALDAAQVTDLASFPSSNRDPPGG
jgi:hypothetical protein